MEGQPRTLGLLEMLQVYLDHRLDVTLRRTKFQLNKAQDRLHLVEGLLLAIVDIDDVIAIIRSSEDAAAARTRLMGTFDLDEVQANYILDMQLRRLTKFSTIELESERDELRERIEGLTLIVNDEAELRRVVSGELAEVSSKYGTPRHTVLLGAASSVAAASAPLEVPDDPCWVLLSATGLLARIDTADGLPSGGDRATHDVIISSARTTARSDFGIITSAGRLVRVHAVELASLPITATAPSVAGGTPLADLVGLEKGERALAVTSLSGEGPSLALGTRNGIVKRVNPELLGKESWEVIGLKDGDEVVGAVEMGDEDLELCFVTQGAALLHFPASAVRPQGRSGGGVAGIKAKDPVIFFGAAPRRGSSVVTVAASSPAAAGKEPGSIKLTPLDQYPPKGRATGGMRCQRFLKGEAALVFAWIGPDPAVACAASGMPIELPAPNMRRDGSGDQGRQPILAVGSRRHGSNKDNPVSDGSNDALDSGDPLSSNEKQIDSQPELFS
ncbi:topoisomerase IV subunit A [Cutibacterium acnes JCM 18909]|nr:topoisomerase IV subunit A [Cutibacterium acnes JCM 18909]